MVAPFALSDAEDYAGFSIPPDEMRCEADDPETPRQGLYIQGSGSINLDIDLGSLDNLIYEIKGMAEVALAHLNPLVSYRPPILLTGWRVHSPIITGLEGIKAQSEALSRRAAAQVAQGHVGNNLPILLLGRCSGSAFRQLCRSGVGYHRPACPPPHALDNVVERSAAPRGSAIENLVSRHDRCGFKTYSPRSLWPESIF